MGRCNKIPQKNVLMKLQQLQWVDGDYDEGGAYWGGPEHKGTEYIWWAYTDDEEAANDTSEVFVRAKDRIAAKLALARLAPFAIIQDDFDLNVDEMLEAYIVCALWSTDDESTPDGGVPFDNNYGPEDVSRDARKEMRRDVAKFLREHAADIGDNLSQAGHDLWLTRGGHGCGFANGGRVYTDESAERLADAARMLGEAHLYVDANGRIGYE